MDKIKNRIQIKNDIEDGDVELDPKVYLNPKNHKVRINAYIDGDVYAALNERAEKGEGKGRYQTLMNELLREVVFKSTQAKEPVQLDLADLRKVFKQNLRMAVVEVKGSKKTSRHTSTKQHSLRTRHVRAAASKVRSAKS